MSALGRLFRKKEKSQRLLTVFEQLNAEFREDIVRRRKHLASNPRFNLVIGFVIILETIIIGIEVDNSRGELLQDRIPFFIIDFLFTLIFFGEMLLRQNQLGWDYFSDGWNIFDYGLVVLACGDLVVSATQDGTQIRLATTLRIFRLARVVRVIKGLKVAESLWMIVSGLLDSLRTMFWLGIFLVILVYCLGLSLMLLAGSDPTIQERWRYTDVYFGSVFKSMWTILQVMTMDRWAVDVGRPIFELAWGTGLLLILSIIILTFGVLKILLAVMIERMVMSSQESRENTVKALEKVEKDLLMSMVGDFKAVAKPTEGGVLGLNFEDFSVLIRSKSIRYKLSLLHIRIDEAESLFELMDVDGSGTVTPDEFIQGVTRMKGLAKGQDMVQIICFTQKQCLRVSRFLEKIRVLNVQADLIQERMNSMGMGITKELLDREKADKRNDQTWVAAAHLENALNRLDEERKVTFPSLKK